MAEGMLFRTINRCGVNAHSCCSVPSCGACGEELDFHVTDRFGQPQNDLKKIHNGGWNECCSRGDRYELVMPHDEVEAALMLAAVQMVDMLFFENPW
mmetsp:Transcript_12248/g.8911  ORF Transcript_12248/g.8911 Transcript_12248/m.8911 type:complete len:97 (+) Transcript_12248:349-639(+)